MLPTVIIRDHKTKAETGYISALEPESTETGSGSELHVSVPGFVLQYACLQCDHPQNLLCKPVSPTAFSVSYTAIAPAVVISVEDFRLWCGDLDRWFDYNFIYECSQCKVEHFVQLEPKSSCEVLSQRSLRSESRNLTGCRPRTWHAPLEIIWILSKHSGRLVFQIDDYWTSNFSELVLVDDRPGLTWKDRAFVWAEQRLQRPSAVLFTPIAAECWTIWLRAQRTYTGRRNVKPTSSTASTEVVEDSVQPKKTPLQVDIVQCHKLLLKAQAQAATTIPTILGKRSRSPEVAQIVRSRMRFTKTPSFDIDTFRKADLSSIASVNPNQLLPHHEPEQDFFPFTPVSESHKIVFRQHDDDDDVDDSVTELSDDETGSNSLSDFVSDDSSHDDDEDEEFSDLHSDDDTCSELDCQSTVSSLDLASIVDDGEEVLER